MGRDESLQVACRRFCDHIKTLLNNTICESVHVGWTERPDGQVVVGTRFDLNPLRPKPVRVTTASKEAKCWLSIVFRLDYDDRNYLTVMSSVWAISTGEAAEKELFHFDYERGKERYPEAHFQINAANGDFTKLMNTTGMPRKSLNRVHFPVGGRRFRPTLEDVIEFLVDEKIAMFRDEEKGRKQINEGRDEFRRKQLKAAIARDPITARAALDELPTQPANRKTGSAASR